MSNSFWGIDFAGFLLQFTWKMFVLKFEVKIVMDIFHYFLPSYRLSDYFLLIIY